ncbi:hypothetical protein L3C95_27195 [Chitinophaga filiformis]|uniref:hypothetical protein n=1 Tax=Chitinophaga filiformis TaxID=104663 RepID=UPI001F306654|nr:hypothetical protein [Chitinophaga filiformis]MCF6406614.1 hypothetical protein [Chitinophaga filiformis]
MKKSTYLFSIVLLFFFGLIACQQQQKSPTTSEASAHSTDINDEIRLICVNKGLPERGATLPYGLAEKCFKEYDSVMKKYCFLHDTGEVRRENDPRNLPGTARRRQVDSFRVITRSESFLGTDVICWLAKRSLLAPDTSKIVTELRMGMYTEDFLDNAASIYGKDPKELKKDKLGRVTVFLVPYTKSGNKRLPPSEVYDFGSLQP